MKIESIKPVQNNVIIKIDKRYHTETNSGILTPVGFVDDEKYSNRGYHVVRSGEVVKQPERLVKDKRYGSYLPHNIDIVGRTVYFHPIDIANGDFIRDDDNNLYLILKYHTLLLSTAPYTGQEYNNELEQLSEDKSLLITPLNGNLIVRRITEPTSELDIKEERYKEKIVKVIYAGYPNDIEYEEHKQRNYSVNPGHICFVRNEKFPPLEYEIYANMPTDLKVIKRSDVQAILK